MRPNIWRCAFRKGVTQPIALEWVRAWNKQISISHCKHRNCGYPLCYISFVAVKSSRQLDRDATFYLHVKLLTCRKNDSIIFYTEDIIAPHTQKWMQELKTCIRNHSMSITELHTHTHTHTHIYIFFIKSTYQ